MKDLLRTHRAAAPRRMESGFTLVVFSLICSAAPALATTQTSAPDADDPSAIRTGAPASHLADIPAPGLPGDLLARTLTVEKGAGDPFQAMTSPDLDPIDLVGELEIPPASGDSSSFSDGANSTKHHRSFSSLPSGTLVSGLVGAGGLLSSLFSASGGSPIAFLTAQGSSGAPGSPSAAGGTTSGSRGPTLTSGSNINIAATPEPGVTALLGAGLLSACALRGAARRNRRKGA